MSRSEKSKPQPDGTRTFRVVNLKASNAEPEFEVPADATDEQIAEAAADAVAEYLSYGWEPVDEEG